MLPPLRERTDLDALVASLLRELGGQHPPSIDPEVLELFRRHPWPGNLRQLSNLLRTAVVMAEGEATIRCEHLPDDFIEDVLRTMGLAAATDSFPTAAVFPRNGVPAAQGPGSPGDPAPARVDPPEVAAGRLQDMALHAIRDALARNGGNMSSAARELGVSRSTLYRKLQD